MKALLCGGVSSQRSYARKVLDFIFDFGDLSSISPIYLRLLKFIFDFPDLSSIRQFPTKTYLPLE
ncbi:hypothetical protein FS935_21330 [Metabacillus litoralis]|uniref:Uncharacterized protein n=1 Tax=Metabacillus litoralis TaxID=152268 RepID=A0A5C6VBC9_9BACI|nr:hypothetical protein [Metabacillus litoralis]TXC81891.1 hypothetical protein FS935_21330 [Metabacillus litoralis]